MLTVNLQQIDRMLSEPRAAVGSAGMHSPEDVALLQRVRSLLTIELLELNDRVRVALTAQHPQDLRPLLRDFVRGHARIHGRSTAEQMAAFAREGNTLFCDLFLLAVGFDPYA